MITYERGKRGFIRSCTGNGGKETAKSQGLKGKYYVYIPHKDTYEYYNCGDLAGPGDRFLSGFKTKNVAASACKLLGIVPYDADNGLSTSEYTIKGRQ